MKKEPKLMHVIEINHGGRRVRVQFDNKRRAIKLGTKLLEASYPVRYYRLADPISLTQQEVTYGVNLVKKFLKG